MGLNHDSGDIIQLPSPRFFRESELPSSSDIIGPVLSCLMIGPRLFRSDRLVLSVQSAAVLVSGTDPWLLWGRSSGPDYFLEERSGSVCADSSISTRCHVRLALVGQNICLCCPDFL